MHACPYRTADYAPPPEAERPEQLVFVWGQEQYRARTCPVGVVREHRLGGRAFDSYLWLNEWHQLPWPGPWPAQPAWWVEAMGVMREMFGAVEREALEKA